MTLDDMEFVVEYDKTYNPLYKKEIDAKVHSNVPFFDFLSNKKPQSAYKPGDCVVVHGDPLRLPDSLSNEGDRYLGTAGFPQSTVPKYDNSPANKGTLRIVRNGVPITNSQNLPVSDDTFEVKQVKRNFIIEAFFGPKFIRVKKKIQKPEVTEKAPDIVDAVQNDTSKLPDPVSNEGDCYPEKSHSEPWFPRYNNLPDNTFQTARNDVPASEIVNDLANVPLANPENDPGIDTYEVKQIKRNFIINAFLGPRFTRVKKIQNPKV